MEENVENRYRNLGCGYHRLFKTKNTFVSKKYPFWVLNKSNSLLITISICMKRINTKEL